MDFFSIKRKYTPESTYNSEEKWTFFVQKPLHIGFERRIKLREDSEWSFGHDWVDIFFTRHWSWGRDRMYYDGPLDGLGLGFARITWRDWNRKYDE